jgi:hypothetical protein
MNTRRGTGTRCGSESDDDAVGGIVGASQETRERRAAPRRARTSPAGDNRHDIKERALHSAVFPQPCTDEGRRAVLRGIASTRATAAVPAPDTTRNYHDEQAALTRAYLRLLEHRAAARPRPRPACRAAARPRAARRGRTSRGAAVSSAGSGSDGPPPAQVADVGRDVGHDRNRRGRAADLGGVVPAARPTYAALAGTPAGTVTKVVAITFVASNVTGGVGVIETPDATVGEPAKGAVAGMDIVGTNESAAGFAGGDQARGGAPGYASNCSKRGAVACPPGKSSGSFAVRYRALDDGAADVLNDDGETFGAGTTWATQAAHATREGVS